MRLKGLTECVQFQQYPCSYIAEWLKGEFCHIAGISASCSLRQTVYAVFKLTVWSRALKDFSASLAFEGAGLLSSSRLNAASVDLLIVVRTQAEWSNQHRMCAQCKYPVSIRQISKVLVLCCKSHFITFSCYHHLQGHQVVINDTAKEFSTKLQRERSDQIALKMCTKWFPKIGRYGQHKIQRCIVHMIKKQTISKIWKYVMALECELQYWKS